MMVDVRALTNDGWGFASNCFVCEAKNERGLRIPFAHDEERDVVVAEFELDDAFSGAPTYAHGGVLLAILDEAMAWAAIAIAGSWAVTTETTARFEHPVRIGRAYRVEARISGQHDDRIDAEATIVDAKDRTCASATASFTPLGPAQAADATGTAVAEEHRRYLRS